ncbi:phosphatase PAP2 family protein [Synechococcus sp. KORDI-52]|uniref:phosphatase PAP2 family protein n=1 Tax=Synechococcus sp. KORDI-52 TaxID=585425 RepID=UPI0008FFC609
MIRSGVPQFVHLVDEVKNKLKNAIGRPRPFLSHRDLTPCLPREYSESYPSGHSTWYVTTSLLLAACCLLICCRNADSVCCRWAVRGWPPV